jgi:hypothetical protein
MDKIDKLVKLVFSELEGGKTYIEHRPAGESDLYPYGKVLGYHYHDKEMVLYMQRSFAPKGLGENFINIYRNIPHFQIILTSLPKNELEEFIKKMAMATLTIFSEIVDINKVKITNVNNLYDEWGYSRVYFDYEKN